MVPLLLFSQSEHIFCTHRSIFGHPSGVLAIYLWIALDTDQTLDDLTSVINISLTMKKNILFSLLGLMMSLASVAQNIGDRAKENATNKANSRVDTRIDQGIDKGFDAIEGLFKKKDKKSKNQGTDSQNPDYKSNDTAGQDSDVSSTRSSDRRYEGGQLGGIMSPATIESSYSFIIDMDVSMTNTSKKGKEEVMTMTMYFGDQVMAMNTGLEGEKTFSTMIFDVKNSSSVMLSMDKGKKEGIALNMSKNQLDRFVKAVADDQSNASITATGQTKTILGKHCEEYLLNDPDNHAESRFWITQDVDGEILKNAMDMMGQQTKNQMPANYPDGLMMEAHGKDTKNGKSWVWQVTRLSERSAASYDMGDWNVKDIMGNTY